jgi:hypothetical protein
MLKLVIHTEGAVDKQVSVELIIHTDQVITNYTDQKY